jgi:hypothetical protein
MIFIINYKEKHIVKLKILIVLFSLNCSIPGVFGEEVGISQDQEKMTFSEHVKTTRMKPLAFTELIAKSKVYDGKEVLLEGYVTDLPEDNHIYLCRDYAEHGMRAGRINYTVREPGPWIRGDKTVDYRLKWKVFAFPTTGGKGAYARVIGKYKAPSVHDEGGGSLEDVWFIFQFNRR